jgi:hypothetical protein
LGIGFGVAASNAGARSEPVLNFVGVPAVATRREFNGLGEPALADAAPDSGTGERSESLGAVEPRPGDKRARAGFGSFMGSQTS